MHDTKGEGPLAVAFYKEYTRLEPKRFIVAHASPFECAYVAPYLIDDGLINTAGLQALSSLYPAGYSVAMQPACEEMLVMLLRWMMMEYPKAMDKPAPTKVGVICWDIPLMTQTLGAPWLFTSDKNPAWAKLEKEYGCELVGWERIGIAAPDATPQVRRLAKAGADIILLEMCSHGPGVVARSARTLGLLDKFVWSIPLGAAYDNAAIELAGDPRLLEGMYAVLPAYSAQEPLPQSEKMWEVAKAYNRDLNKAGVSNYPWVAGVMTWCWLAAERTIDDLGGWAGAIEKSEWKTPGDFHNLPQKLQGELMEWWGGNMPQGVYLPAEIYLWELMKMNPHFYEPVWGTWEATYLPGKVAAQVSVIGVVKDGETRHASEGWVWTPEIVSSDLWTPIPLDGTVNYQRGGVWDFDRFVKIYDPPLWYLIFEYAYTGEGVNIELDADRFNKVLDKYREIKGLNAAEMAKILEGFMDKSTPPSSWVKLIGKYTSIAIHKNIYI